MTKRLALAAAAAALCLPASAMAAGSAGVVLSIDANHHALQFVDARHAVHAYHFRGQLPGVGLGSRLRISYSGKAITHAIVAPGRARTVQFLAKIVQIGTHGVVLRLGDRRLLRVPAMVMRRQVRKQRRLARGAVVLVTEIVSSHSFQPISARPGASTGGSAGSKPGATTSDPGASSAIGTVVELDPSGLSLQAGDGSTLHFAAAPSVSAKLQLSVCDVVSVSFHNSGGKLVADSIQANNGSPVAACDNGGSGGGSGAPGQDLVGTISRMDLTSVTIAVSGAAPMSFTAGVDLTAGFVVGDQVDVTYSASGPTWLASDVEYQGLDAIGTVGTVGAGSVTIALSDTGQPMTFTDDPANQTFDGISPGDQIDVSYHLSSGQPVLDSVSDMTTGS